MADVTPFRQNIQNEDIQFRSSVSEAVGGKLGGSINFINDYQHFDKPFFLNGSYSNNPGLPQLGVDGAFVFDKDVYIFAIDMYNLVAGSSGILELDLIRHTSSGTVGTSIFTTRPSIDFSSGNNAYLGKRFFDNVVLSNPAGTILPVLAVTQLNAGDMLTCNLTAVQAGGQSGGIKISFRIR